MIPNANLMQIAPNPEARCHEYKARSNECYMTPDARISRMSMPMPSALNDKDTKHLKKANGNSTSVFPDPKSVSRDCNHHRHPEPSPATPEELSSTAPPCSAAEDPSTEMFPPVWLKFLETQIAPAGRGGRTMI